MKVFARFFLFLFLAFLAAPTIVVIIKKSCDISVFFDFSEEEEEDSQKDIKNFVHQELVNIELINVCFEEIELIFSNTIGEHDNVVSFIFAPPPNLG
ncbi:hypothetical protein DNC80_15420 [Flavobacterium sp. SOK18b]|uniref:hypothetical protein n=1 Tax=Flavobacterium sp. SOK18b TaxID=797900 RepID=UPI0015F79613|nr:hypothetical protein [Flavobacterium sp. SOK18b]MBB1195054.1 hypothetical protein [Flavobacterium sp. SOK18b]